MGIVGLASRDKNMLKSWINRKAMVKDLKDCVKNRDLDLLRLQLKSNANVAFIFYIVLGLKNGKKPASADNQVIAIIEKIKEYRESKKKQNDGKNKK